MIPPERIVPLDSDEGARIVETLRAGGFTALVGSGVSGFAPTSLPTGWDVGKAVAERLAEKGVSACDLLVEILSNTAFEQVMERCPNPEWVREVLSRRFRDVPPNDVHRAFARLTESGVIRHLVTTNYDVGLEAAFRDATPSVPLTMVRDRAEAERVAHDAPHVLFKIHGCATGPFAREMAFRLTDEAQLVPWKRETLRRLVAGRTLLVVAYSGMDFEICPELPAMGATRLVWLHYGPLERMTPNAWRVVREAGGMMLLGSAQALAGALLGEDEVDATWAPGAVDDFAAELFGGFDEEALDAWRARLFGEIGCGRDAAVAADRLLDRAVRRGDDAARARAYSRRAQGLFHQGRYVAAAADYARAARMCRRVGDLHELRGALNGVVECNRCAGRMGRTLLALGALARFVRRARGTPEHAPARTDARMRLLVLRRHAYQLVSGLPRRRGLRRLRKRLRAAIRERARRDLGEVSAFAAEVGNWMMLQQARLWTGRYDLRWERVYRGTMSPLPSRAGYRQLGYVVAHSMAIRDEGRAPDPAELGRLLGTLVEVGASPEAWKLARLAERWLGPAAVPPQVRAAVERGWRECQITARRRRAMEREFG